MKRIIFTCMLLAMGFGAAAQIDFGPRVNLTSTNLSLKDNVQNVEEGDAEFGYQLGAFLRVQVPLVGIYVQPEVLFSNPNSSLNYNSQKLDYNFNQIDVPVMIGLSLGPVRLNAGPSFRFMTGAEITDPNGVVTDVKENYKNSTVGFQAGAGIDIWKLVFDLKYEGSLSEINEDIALPIPGSPVIDQRVSQWVFGVGFKIF